MSKEQPTEEETKDNEKTGKLSSKHWAVMVIAVCGVIIFILSVFIMRDNWRAGVSKTDKTELVTNGIYQISRDLAFLGFDLVYTGILWMFFNWVLLAISVFAAFMFYLQIVNVEEDFLESSFGESYLEYKKGRRL